MNDTIALLREHLESIAPYPKGCVSFDGRPTFNGTAFFPGGDGLVKHRDSQSVFLFGGTLVLGSDFGDVAWFDRQFEDERTWRDEATGATWRGMLTLIDLACIPRETLFCTNAWPVLREGDEPVKGGISGERDSGFTQRCIAFFKRTVELMKPTLMVPQGVAPTRFVGMSAPDQLSVWARASTWKQIDELPVAHAFGARIVPIVHPSMPNRRHRVAAKTLAEEAALLRWQIEVGLDP